MTMHTVHSPKPEVFGKGYGAHLAYNFKLVRLFYKLALKIFINAIVPGVYYEQAHWQIIELYYMMRGTRHGTNSDHRCNECGGDLISCDDEFKRRDEIKDLKEQVEELESRPQSVYPVQAVGELHGTSLEKE